MFRFATGVTSDGNVAYGRVTTQGRDGHPPVAEAGNDGIAYQATGFQGMAARPGWGNLFGGAEREKQKQDWLRSHQATRTKAPGMTI